MALDRPRRITLNDIARACGVSRATVSLVLRGSPLVHADTRRRVEAEMQRQGYVYNRAAANLRQRVSSAVALVINDLSNPFFAEFAAGVDEALGAKGYVTLLGSSNESPARQRQVLGSLMEHHPAGIILSPAEASDAADIELAIGRNTPLLVFNRQLVENQAAGFDYDFLGLDNRAGARTATERLLALGHRGIAFYGGHADSSSCRERRLGYEDALRGAGIAVDPRWMIETAPTRIEANAHADALFADAPAPTAAVCYNDAVALGLMLGLARLGRHPGVDFAVTGFDDIPEAAVGIPPLTTLNADPRARGRQAAELLLQRTATPSLPRRSVIVPVLLTERESTPHAPSA
ncbi:LacI family DNA-binding transcriptional regulator [Pseudoxanthomonas sangjuensis]|uniref:LacI family DNA-binding transcriptional regulator n=1 Tax=Pseudoxanthomonas sangjuensis TaxID=1503750 RepID=UPI001390A5B4|nr:LacI family DNA-binding transcriptional regulator [Pseudoxanthomonas sangjuensis]KAF1710252.1 transcriptional regulator [Pseudoxanthomonas sangjuensis]